MSSSKNKSLLKAIFITTLFASFAAKAENYVIDFQSTNQFNDFSDPSDTLVINADSSIIVNGDAAIDISGETADSIINNGFLNITNQNPWDPTVTINDGSVLNLFINNGTIGTDVDIEGEGTSVTTVTNTGDIGHDLNVELATVVTLNNSGNIFDDIDIDDAFITTINNSGNVGGYIDIYDSQITTLNNSGTVGDDIYTYESSITAINNSGTVGNDIYIEYSEVDIINNSGIVDEDIYVYESNGLGEGSIIINNSGIVGEDIDIEYSQVDIINNSGTVGEDIDIYESSITAIKNSGTVFGDINIEDSFVEMINNSGTIFGDINVEEDEGEGSFVGVINNSGTISGGVFIDSDSSIDEVVNSGRIGSVPGDFSVVFDSDEDNTLTLNPGSQIIGRILFSTGDDTININAGPQVSSTYYYRDPGIGELAVNAAPGLIVVHTYEDEEGASNGKIAVVDPSSFTTAQETSLKSSIDIGNIIADRLTQARAENNASKVAQNDSYVELAALNKNTNSDVYTGAKVNNFDNNQAFFWSEAFGSYQERAAYKNNGESESTTGGIIIGADKAVAADQRVGAFVGALKGSTDITVANNVVSSRIDSKGLFAGAYLSQSHNGTCFTDFSLIAGVLDNDSDRVVYDGGTQIAKAEYSSIFITPSATIGTNLNTPVIPTILSATLRYTGQWVESYDEEGTTSDISADSRYLNTVSTRLKIETNNKSRNVANGNFNLNFRTGVEANRVLGSQNVDINVIGQNVAVGQDNRDYNIDGFVGVNTSYDLSNSLRIYADIEGTKGITKSVSNNDLGLYGKFGLKFGF